ncbi:MAG: insulinase family protein [Alphaproteobacteria bacterium]|nr:insulinase family protein [Alphaproteobacteria bacterium]
MNRTSRIGRRALLRVAAGAPALALLRGAPAHAAAAIERVSSPGGIQAWLIVDRSLPLLSLEFNFRGGAATLPAGKEGLAPMTASLLTEGAGDLDTQAFNAIKEDRSISLGFGGGVDAMTGSLRTLTRHRDEAVRLAALALNQPRFDAAAIERARARMTAAVQRGANDPQTLASRLWFRTAFPDHPYGRRVNGSVESLAGLTRDDIAAFHRARFARDNLVIGAVGDIDAAGLGALLDRIFGGLPARAAPNDVPAATMAGTGQTLVLQRPLPQTYVLFGEPGLLRADPDFYVATVMNHILGGGGFSARLMLEVRERRGLTYGVSSGLAAYDRSGLILGSFSSDNARAAEALAIVRAEWRRMANDGVTAEELADAKSNINGSFPLGLDSTARLAGTLASIQYQDLGIDYIERRPSYIDAVTRADIQRVARRLLDADRLLVVAVGQAAGLAGTPVQDAG